MKKLFILACALTVVQSCGKQVSTQAETSEPYPINLDFRTGFANDSAVVVIDGAVVASVGSLTTSPIIVLAGTCRFSIVPGEHVLLVLIPKDMASTDISFVHLDQELWIGVSYDREYKRIQYLFQHSPFYYR